MVDRILKHEPQPKQIYWRRLRHAEYFDDESDPELRFAREHFFSEESSENAEHEQQPEEPDQHEPGEVIMPLRSAVQQHAEENKELEERLTNVMDVLAEMRAAMRQRSNPMPQIKSGMAVPRPDPSITDRSERSGTTGADGDINTTPSDTSKTVNTRGAEGTGAAGATTGSTGRAETGTQHSPGRGGSPTSMSETAKARDSVPLESVGPRMPPQHDDRSSTSSALSSRHEREAMASTRVPSESQRGNGDTGGASSPEENVDTAEAVEPSAEPPKLAEGAMGLQQLLIGSKTLRVITMDKLYSANKDAIITWRIKRKHYLKQVTEHNAGHAIKLEARPVKEFVDEVIWNAVSKKKLLDHHKTGKGKPANHKQCAAYFTGTGKYKGLVTTVSTDAIQVLKSVKYQKGRQGATHEDRWFSFSLVGATRL